MALSVPIFSFCTGFSGRKADIGLQRTKRGAVSGSLGSKMLFINNYYWLFLTAGCATERISRVCVLSIKISFMNLYCRQWDLEWFCHIFLNHYLVVYSFVKFHEKMWDKVFKVLSPAHFHANYHFIALFCFCGQVKQNVMYFYTSVVFHYLWRKHLACLWKLQMFKLFLESQWDLIAFNLISAAGLSLHFWHQHIYLRILD